jgi:hypothetical protein
MHPRIRFTALMAAMIAIALTALAVGGGLEILPFLAAASFVGGVAGYRIGQREHQRGLAAGRQPSTSTASGEFWRELERSRRFEHQFTIATIGTIDGEAFAQGDPRIPTIAKSIRNIDHLWASGGRSYVLMPETGHAEAEQALARVTRNLAAKGAEDVRIEHATFPDDGVTGNVLLDLLHAKPTERKPTERKAPATHVVGGATLAEAPALVGDEDF